MNQIGRSTGRFILGWQQENRVQGFVVRMGKKVAYHEHR